MKISLTAFLLLPFSCVVADIFGDIENGLKIVSNIVESAKEGMKEGGCQFECPVGTTKIQQPGHEPSSDGCGSLGVEVDLSHLPALGKCCDRHDHCYDECGTQRGTCDTRFHDCLLHACQQMQDRRKTSNHNAVMKIDMCHVTANVIYESVTALGCKSYLDAQKRACLCQREEL